MQDSESALVQEGGEMIARKTRNFLNSATASCSNHPRPYPCLCSDVCSNSQTKFYPTLPSPHPYPHHTPSCSDVCSYTTTSGIHIQQQPNPRDPSNFPDQDGRKVSLVIPSLTGETVVNQLQLGLD
ncbi:hypothetical protein ElyMa_001852800 [Elysia marginata]|uniref:Uncharacterized protein n=1 Tax=Elysia marginata TaxID=1093978 RepID=A0AAV4ELF5_9GAST|nr:hypothetical protein ElyMa_001852800 [Elysia marginata]